MNPKDLERALDDVTWPKDKDALVAHVEQRRESEEVTSAMRALPLAEYRNAQEVMSSVPLDSQDTAIAETLGERERDHGQSGVASELRDR